MMTHNQTTCSQFAMRRQTKLTAIVRRSAAKTVREAKLALRKV